MVSLAELFCWQLLYSFSSCTREAIEVSVYILLYKSMQVQVQLVCYSAVWCLVKKQNEFNIIKNDYIETC